MIKLITGTPGSGKTLYAVSLIIESAKSGRVIFSDIEGLNVQGVMPIPQDLDWRETPEGALVVYDEAQQNEIFKAGRGTLSDNKIVSDLEIHRHTGHDIIFITQSPIFMHNHIRQLVGEHFHLHRPYGAAVASVYQWRVCENNPNVQSAKNRSENNSFFNFDKKLFEHYKSATVHTHKFKVPSKIRNILIVFFCLIAFTFYLFQQTTFFKKPAVVETTTTTTTTGTLPPVAAPDLEYFPSTGAGGLDQQTQQHEMQRVAYVVEFGSDCYAKNSFGELLDIPLDKCRFYSDHPSMLSGSRMNQREYAQTQQPQGFALPSAPISPISSESTKNDLNQVKL
jgi:hypothetical protein